MILPVWGDKLQLQANVLYGQGIGRYDAAQLPDVTVNPDGTLTPLTGFSIMGGITSHNAIKDLDLYAYAGENHVFNHVTFVPGKGSFGFGDGTIDNSNCTSGAITNSTSSCAAQINDVWQVTAGFWHSLYDGEIGQSGVGCAVLVHEGHDPRARQRRYSGQKPAPMQPLRANAVKRKAQI